MISFLKKTSAIGLCLVAFSLLPNSVSSQSIRDAYEDRERQRQMFLRQQAARIVEPLKNVESCYQINLLSGNSGPPYVCRVKNSTKFIMIYGQGSPLGYYEGQRIEGTFYGESFNFVNLDRKKHYSKGNLNCLGRVLTHSDTSFTFTFTWHPFCEGIDGPWECHIHDNYTKIIDEEGYRPEWRGTCYGNVVDRFTQTMTTRKVGLSYVSLREIVKNFGAYHRDSQ